MVSSSHGQFVCDTTTGGGGWIIFNRRLASFAGFERNWEVYKSGFGDLNGDFWMWLDRLVYLCPLEKPCQVRAEWIYNGDTFFVEYNTFSVADESDNYRMVGPTTAGRTGAQWDKLSINNGVPFSTFDNDNDGISGGHCASWGEAGFWYKSDGNCCNNNHYDISGKWSVIGRGDIHFNDLPVTILELKVRI